MDSSELSRHRLRDAHLNGSTFAGPHARHDVLASWQRVSAAGVDPSGGPQIEPLTESEVRARRSAGCLEQLMPLLESALRPVVDSGQLVIIADAEGRVLWRLGRPAARRLADGLGFVTGSAWTEGNVGTNAIGTALVLGEPVHIHGAEHFVESHTRWACAAAPLHDPWTGRQIGVVDISGPRTSMHPSLLSTVGLAARVGSLELLDRHRRSLEELRSGSAHVLNRVGGPAAIIDRAGHVAASSGLAPHGTVALPDELQPGTVHVPGLGRVVVEPVPGGWLLRPSGGSTTVTRVVLDLTDEPGIEVVAESGPWSRRLTPRHAEVLLALFRAGSAGLNAAALADDVFADPTRVVTVRAEMSRLRKTLGGLILSRPYRLSPSVETDARWPAGPELLLPRSSAPVVHRTRAWLTATKGAPPP